MRHSLALLTACLAALAIVHCGGDEPSAARTADSGGPETDPPRADAADASVEEPPPATEGSGSRFRTVHYTEVWDDGTERRSFLGQFFDRETGDACSIVPTTADQYACLPYDLDRADEAFADETCTTPALVVPFDVTTWVRWGPRCATKLARRPAASLITTGTAYRKDPVTQVCRVYRSAVKIAPMPTEIPASSFGTFTRKEETAPFPGERSGSRLVLQGERFDGTDGSFEWRAPRVVDLSRMSTGSFERGTDGAFHFFTFFWDFETLPAVFGDAACTTAGVVSFLSSAVCRDDPWRARDGRRKEATCAGAREYARPTSAPLAVTYKMAGACEADLDHPDNYASDRFAVAPQSLVEIPLSDLVTVTRESVPTNVGGRSGTILEVRAAAYSSADGMYLRARRTQLHLRELDFECSLGAGNLCLPTVPSGYRGGYFLDASCQEELTQLTLPCGAPSPTMYSTFAFTGPDSIRRIPDGALLQPATVYRLTENGCTGNSPPPATTWVRESLTTPAFPSTLFPKLMRGKSEVD